MKSLDLPAYCYVNGNFILEEEAVVSIKDRGFRFGDGVFETILVHNSVPFQWEWHLNRLSEGLTSIQLPFDVLSLKKIAKELLMKNQFSNGFIRVAITRGQGSRGYLPDGIIVPTIVMETVADIPLNTERVKAKISDYRRIAPQMLPVQYKLMQGMQSTLARMDAQESGCFEAILLNPEGYIAEGSSSNIFWVKDKILYTPSEECGILRGSVRHFICNYSGVEVQQGMYKLKELEEAESLFFTNAAWGVLPVVEIINYDYTFSITDTLINIENMLKNEIINNAQKQW